MPSLGSAASATSGTDRSGDVTRPFWYAGRAKYLLTPYPPAPVGGFDADPFHQLWDTTFSTGPHVGVVPPTEVAFGESSGTPMVPELPSRQLLPSSPDPLKTDTPLAAAWARIESMLCASAWLTSSSHSDHEFEMTVSPSPIMALNICSKLVLGGAS